MDFSFTDEQIKLRDRLEDFVKKHLTDDMIDEALQFGDVHNAKLYRALADEGLLKLFLPKEFGGEGRSRVDMAIFQEIMGYYEAPLGGYGSTLGIVGRSLIHFGNEKQKKEVLLKVAQGEVICCIGITEPNVGSDAASVETYAEDIGDKLKVNGTKIFITNANISKYILTLVRTDKNLEKHRGLSLLLIDLELPGVKINPLRTMSNWIVNEVVFEDVLVDKENLLGEMNRGWEILNKALQEERTGLGTIRNIKKIFEELLEFAKENEINERKIIQNDYIKRLLAEAKTRIEIARLLFYYSSWRCDEGLSYDVFASYSKLFSSELYHFIADVGMEILGVYGQVKAGDKYCKLKGRIELLYRHCVAQTIGGGTSQIQRNLIARRGLGL